ncbi:TetR/AcrR family transcriptional regulator [Leifsonia sp. Root112D2]|uniref:TetR/AcrR family transcriptional regulator n=1 Tax=Leifsonia sp. Root112D2 TaxID=1736426 RepID=UPI0006F5C4B6|nr:TetR/AcrR family transcriptional regulator [Leifsonia sp. Root112D2]KQV06675.1 TetR family transcriptional regulator [Leifsonia sp. Root112D2]
MANLRVVQKEQTRQRLLETALELFQSKGYAATTIDDIATAAGTTRVTFYAHFPSRRAVMSALIADLNTILERHESPARASTASALVDVVHAGSAAGIADWLRRQSTRWPIIRPYILSAVVAAAVEPEIRELVDVWSEEVADDIQEGLDLADRFEPTTRHFRGVLAFEMLDRTTQHWIRHQWDIDSDPALEVLTEAWVSLLGHPSAT